VLACKTVPMAARAPQKLDELYEVFAMTCRPSSGVRADLPHRLQMAPPRDHAGATSWP